MENQKDKSEMNNLNFLGGISLKKQQTNRSMTSNHSMKNKSLLSSPMKNAKELSKSRTSNSLIAQKRISIPSKKVNFEKLIEEFKVTKVQPFTLYLKDIWKDLSDRSEEKGKGLTQLTFSKVY